MRARRVPFVSGPGAAGDGVRGGGMLRAVRVADAVCAAGERGKGPERAFVSVSAGGDSGCGVGGGDGGGGGRVGEGECAGVSSV